MREVLTRSDTSFFDLRSSQQVQTTGKNKSFEYRYCGEARLKSLPSGTGILWPNRSELFKTNARIAVLYATDAGTALARVSVHRVRLPLAGS